MIEQSEVIEQKMNTKAIPRILCICEHETVMKKVQARVRKEQQFRVEYIEELIRFNVSEQVRKDFGEGWENKDGKQQDIGEWKAIELE